MKRGAAFLILLISSLILGAPAPIVGADPSPVGYEFLDDGAILRVWNEIDSYYFNTSSGIQFSNHYQEWWSKNVLGIGYYSGGEWHVIYWTDTLSGFNHDLDSDEQNYANITLWKNLTYSGYEFRLAIRYHLKRYDGMLTVQPYIKNLGEAIPFDIGFAWRLKDIKVSNDVENDNFLTSWVTVKNITNGESYYLNQPLDKRYIHNITSFSIKDVRASQELAMQWSHEIIDRTVLWVKSVDGQYNAPVTILVKVGTLGSGEEKTTRFLWHDADVVSTTTTTSAVKWAFQRKVWYVSSTGYYYVFYSDGSHIEYCNSTDGQTWSSPYTLAQWYSMIPGVWFDGTYFHVVYHKYATAYHYKRGTPQAGGDITWDSEQTLIGLPILTTIMADSNDYPWVVVKNKYNNTNWGVRAHKSTTKDGTWTEDVANGFPMSLGVNSTWGTQMGSAEALPSGEMLLIKAMGGDTIKSYVWNGSALEDEKVATTSDIEDEYYFSATTIGSIVHLVFLESTSYDIIHVSYNRTADSWSDETTVNTSTTSTSCPSISKDGSNLYVFWNKNNHTNYKKYSGGSWDASPTDWIDESINGMPVNNDIVTYWASLNNEIGIAYLRLMSSPYNVTFALLSIGEEGQEYYRTGSQTIQLSSQTSRSWTLSRVLSQSMTWTSNVYRTWTLSRTLSQSVSWSSSVHRRWNLSRILSQSIGFTWEAIGQLTAGGVNYFRTVSQGLSFAATGYGRLGLYYFRTITQAISTTWNAWGRIPTDFLFTLLVLNSEEAPIDGAYVHMWNETILAFSQETNSSGEIPPQTLRPGNYTLLISSDNYQTYSYIFNILQDTTWTATLRSVEEGALQYLPFAMIMLFAMIFMLLAFTAGDGIFAITCSSLAMLFWIATAWMWVLDNSETARVHFAWLFMAPFFISVLMVFDTVFAYMDKTIEKVDPFA